MSSLNIVNTKFNKMVTIYGSSDLINWVQIKRDNIYDFSAHVELRKTVIALNEPVTFQFYKIELTEQEEQNMNESLRLKYGDLDFSVNKNNTNYTVDRFKLMFSDKKDISVEKIRAIIGTDILHTNVFYASCKEEYEKRVIGDAKRNVWHAFDLPQSLETSFDGNYWTQYIV